MSTSLSPSLLPKRLSDLIGRSQLLGRMAWKPSLLSLTAGAAMLSAVANAVAVGAAQDPTSQTRMGASIQQSLGERDQQIAKQKRALDLREQAMRAAEQRLKADMQAKQGGDPGQQAGTPDSEAPQPFDDLARIYQTMKPARAAPIFERLDLEVQVAIAKRMRERAMAMILSNMSPGAAVKLSMALAGRRASAPVGPQVAEVTPEALKRVAEAKPEQGRKPTKRKPRRAQKLASAEPVAAAPTVVPSDASVSAKLGAQ